MECMKCDVLVGSDNVLSLKLNAEDYKRFKLSLLNDQIKVIIKYSVSQQKGFSSKSSISVACSNLDVLVPKLVHSVLFWQNKFN